MEKIFDKLNGIEWLVSYNHEEGSTEKYLIEISYNDDNAFNVKVLLRETLELVAYYWYFLDEKETVYHAVKEVLDHYETTGEIVEHT